MKEIAYTKSRRRTIWEDRADLTPTESFVRDKIEEPMKRGHEIVMGSGAAEEGLIRVVDNSEKGSR